MAKVLPWHAWMCSLAMACLALPGAAAQSPSDDPLTAVERDWLAEHGPLRYGYEPGYAPFEFTDARGHAVGINFDVLDAMARNLDIRIDKIRYDDFDGMMQATRDGDLDLIGTINKTAERDVEMDFSDPYVRLSSVFYVTDQHPKARSIEDLEGMQVGVVDSYVSGAWLQETHPQLDVVAFDDLDGLLDALAAQRIDAAFEESATVGYMARANGITNIRVMAAGAFLQSDQHWAVPEGEDILVSILNKGLASIPLGEQTKIFEYWTGYDLGVSHPATESFSPLARNIILGTSGLVVLAGLWSATLHRQVKHRTRDLSEEVERRRQVESDVRRLNQGLEERVARRTEELQRSNEELRAFADTLSHDLQSPLSVVAIHSNLIEARYGDDAKAVDSAHKIAAAGQRMNTLIKGTLAYAKAKSKPSMRPVGLDDVLHDAMANLEAVTQAVDGRIRVAPLPIVEGSDVQLVQLFQNLIGNALKFHRDGVAPHIQVTADQDGGMHHIHVQDNGTGFDQERLHVLMEPFSRLAEHRHVDGHGIGLAACARIVEHHGGRLTASSVPGQGSRFTVWLPQVIEAGVPAFPLSDAATRATPRRPSASGPRRVAP